MKKSIIATIYSKSKPLFYLFNMVFLLVLTGLTFVGCGESKLTQLNETEIVLQIKQSILRDAPSGYHNFELIVDSVHARYIKDSVSAALPKIDTLINLSLNKWNFLSNSFNMDKIMTLDSMYVSGLGSELVTIEITTNKRFKKVTFEYPNKLNLPVNVLDSLNNSLNALVKGL